MVGVGVGTQFRTDIQGLRAIAVGGVLLYHAGIPFVGGGFVGVDVFFVISGFLITSHLLRSLDTDGRIGFARFYARRARRILPASFVVLAATIVGILIWVPPSLQPGFLRDAAATALYIPNIFFAVQGTDYLAETAPSPLQHYWSLGVEEQFYLFWPLLLLVIWMLVHRRRSGVIVVGGAVALASLGAAIALTYSPLQPWAFFSLPTRAWELLAGGLIAAAVPWIARWSRPVVAAAGWIGILTIAVSMVVIDSDEPFPGFAAIAPVLGTMLVIASGTAGRVPLLEPVLALRPVQFVGRISYSLYLVHWPLLIIPAAAGGAGAILHGWPAVLVTALSVPLAWLLYRFVESPFQRSAWSTRRRPRVVLASALVASLVFVSVSVGAASAISNRQFDAGTENEPVVELSIPPVFSNIVPSNMTPTLATASADVPELYADGCHVSATSSEIPDGCSYGDVASDTVVALFGDSHAAQWFPALERLGTEQGFRLDSYTRSNCPAAAVQMVVDGVEDTGCASWRDAVVDRLDAAPPALVVISGFSHYADYDRPDVDSAAWTAGLAATLGALPATTEVVVISDTPAFSVTPSTCLSVHVEDASACARPRDEAISDDWNAAEAEAARAAGATVVDLDDYLCDDTSCGLIVGDRLMYRDANHLTASFVELLAQPLGDAIAPLIAP